MKIVILCLQTMKKRMKHTLWGQKFLLKRDSKNTNKDQSLRSILKTCKNTKSGFAFLIYWRHNSAILKMKLIILASVQDRAIDWYHCYLLHPSHSSLKRQQNPLSAEKVCTYHPGMSYLADLSKNKRHSQNMIMIYQAVHNDFPKSIMCTPHEVFHS